MTRNRALTSALTLLGVVLLVASATILGNHYFGHGRAAQALSSAPLPPSLSPSLTPAPTLVPELLTSSTAASARVTPKPAPKPSATASTRATPKPTTRVAPKTAAPHKAVPAKPGTPVQLVVASHHLRATVSANRLNADGSLYTPPNPRAVSWASQDAAPGSTRGTIILVAHINYAGVAGAFSDLANYRVGQTITLVLADGRRLNYAVAAPPLEVDKSKIGARAQELFDQTHSFGPARSGRLLLLSCGGRFSNATGHYESNILVYALPI